MHQFLQFIFGMKLCMFRTENCPKHAEFHSKNKLEKLVNLVGFIIRKLRMDVAIPLLPQYAFKAWKGTSLRLFFLPFTLIPDVGLITIGMLVAQQDCIDR